MEIVILYFSNGLYFIIKILFDFTDFSSSILSTTRKMANTPQHPADFVSQERPFELFTS